MHKNEETEIRPVVASVYVSSDRLGLCPTDQTFTLGGGWGAVSQMEGFRPADSQMSPISGNLCEYLSKHLKIRPFQPQSCPFLTQNTRYNVFLFYTDN
jgi:hypothetical protein